LYKSGHFCPQLKKGEGANPDVGKIDKTISKCQNAGKNAYRMNIGQATFTRALGSAPKSICPWNTA